MSKKKKKIHTPEEQTIVENAETVIDEVVLTDDMENADTASDVTSDDTPDIITDGNSDSVPAVKETAEESAADDVPVKEKKSRGTSQAPRLVMILTAICVVVALLLGVVNTVTEAKIADNAAKAKEIAILAIFEDGNKAELYSTLDDGTEVYLVYRDADLVGYCVFLTVTGFGGDIDMTVGINGEISTCGVKIVNMSETPGVGTKVKTPDFLELFDGLSHDDPIGDVDAISGATISSTAVMSGVKAAHSIDFDFKAVAEDLGVKILTPADLLGIKETETEATTPAESEREPQSDSGAESTEPATVDGSATDESEPAEQTEDIPYVDNGGEKYYVYGVDVTTVDDRYVLEIKKEDETATFEKETKEPETEKTTEKETEAPTTAETTTEAQTTEAPTTAETTTETQTTAPPTTAETSTEPETTAPPETSDTSSSEEDTTDPESTETEPISPDTSDTTETGDPTELDTTGENGARSVAEPSKTSDSTDGEIR